MSSNLIPAQPGYWFLYLDVTEGEPFIDKQPVIAWSVDKWDVTAVTPASTNPTGHALVTPDGRVWHYLSETWFDSVEELVAHLQGGALA